MDAPHPTLSASSPTPRIKRDDDKRYKSIRKSLLSMVDGDNDVQIADEPAQTPPSNRRRGSRGRGGRKTPALKEQNRHQVDSSLPYASYASSSSSSSSSQSTNHFAFGDAWRPLQSTSISLPGCFVPLDVATTRNLFCYYPSFYPSDHSSSDVDRLPPLSFPPLPPPLLLPVQVPTPTRLQPPHYYLPQPQRLSTAPPQWQ